MDLNLWIHETYLSTIAHINLTSILVNFVVMDLKYSFYSLFQCDDGRRAHSHPNGITCSLLFWCVCSNSGLASRMNCSSIANGIEKKNLWLYQIHFVCTWPKFIIEFRRKRSGLAFWVCSKCVSGSVFFFSSKMECDVSIQAVTKCMKCMYAHKMNDSETEPSEKTEKWRYFWPLLVHQWERWWVNKTFSMLRYIHTHTRIYKYTKKM